MTTRRRLDWDLIRVVAVFAVLLGHVTDLGPVLHPELGGYPFVVTPQFGAAALMIVSAYFACETIRRGNPGRWLRNRLARLLPAYLTAVVVIYAIGSYAIPRFNADPDRWNWREWTFGDLVANLTMTQGWHPHPVYLDNAHWTLPVQVTAFVAAAVWWFRRGGAGVRGLALGLVVAPVAVLPLRLLPDSLTGILAVFYTGTGLGRVALFGLGIALWLWGRGRLPGSTLTVLAALAVGQYAYTVDRKIESGLALAVMVGAIALAARCPRWDERVPDAVRRPITWLAGISYGVYLLHQQLGFILARVLVDNGISGTGRLVVVMLAAVAAGWALTVLVERPAHRLLTQGRDRPSRRLSVAAPSMGKVG
jgi:peptidoglycan/LPS O-acetylase OafA/YrhL